MKRHCRLILLAFAVMMILGVAVSAEEPKPGTIISKENINSYKDYLPEESIPLFTKYGMKVKVGEPGKYSIGPKMKEYTDKYSGNVKLDGNRRLLNYVAGIPFPSIDPKDPNAGIKIAWNYEYQPMQPDDDDHTFWFVWVNKNGKVERTVKGLSFKLNYKNRFSVPPMPDVTPNPRDIRFVQGLKIVEPFDVAGTGFTQTHFNPNNPKLDDETVAYVPSVRRLRRLSAAQQYDAYLGTDIAIDDFYGYQGSVLRSKWKYIKKTKVLAVRNSPMPTKFAGWFPDPAKVSFELRDAYVVESYPADPIHHYSKRVHYIDAEFFDTLYMVGYDKKGKPWKIWMQDWKYFPESNTFTFVGNSMIDMQAEHGTVTPAITYPNRGTKAEELSISEYLKKESR